jgi:hypothetical protein
VIGWQIVTVLCVFMVVVGLAYRQDRQVEVEKGKQDADDWKDVNGVGEDRSG